MKKASIIFLCIMMCLLTACSSSPKAPTEDYSLDSGITLTAEAGLSEKSLSQHDNSLQNENIVVAFDATPKELYPEFESLEHYADAIKNANSFETDLSLDSFENLAYEYEGIELDDEIYCYLIVEETETCYWLLQMWCPVELRSIYEPLFPQWLDSIELPETVYAPSFNTKNYDLDCGLSITLPDNMVFVDIGSFEAYYFNDYLHISLQMMDKPNTWTIDDCAKWFANKMNIGEINIDSSGRPCMEDTSQLNVLRYYYYTIYETEDSFVILWQNCNDIYKDSYMEFMLECADSLRVTEVSTN